VKHTITVRLSWEGRRNLSKDWLCPNNIQAQMCYGADVWDFHHLSVAEVKKPVRKVCKCKGKVFYAGWKYCPDCSGKIAKGAK